MKIALAQLNYHVGNFVSNTEKIIKHINKARQSEVDIVIFSELAVCGYPPRDFLEQREFIEQCEIAIKNIAAECRDIAAVVGSPTVNDNPKGKMLFNSAYFLADGQIYAVRHKTLLPTYDIFDEYRYFEPNSEFNVVEYKGKKIALTICEDLWDDQPVENSFAKNRLYRTSPMKEIMPQKPDFIINIASSPFSYNQEGVRQEVLIKNAQKYKLPLFYVNQVGAQTELIFDGDSLCIDSEGKNIHKLKMFEEDFRIFELEGLSETVSDPINTMPIIEKIHNALVLGIKDYFRKSNFTKATLGLSGGIDSAVTVVLAVRALGNQNVKVLLMPSQYSSVHSITDAVELANNLDIEYEIISIKNIYESFSKSLKPLFKDLPFNVTEENIQARIRGTLVMAMSNKFGNILLNTSNKSETAVGYGTLYGDMNGGLAVLGDVYKTDVFKMARFMNRNEEIIPENTITKPPSAELAPDQKDSDSLPPYDVLDKILYQYIELKKGLNEMVKAGFERDTVKRVISMVNRNEFKRFQTPPILRISSKAFGMGRRMPLVAKY